MIDYFPTTYIHHKNWCHNRGQWQHQCRYPHTAHTSAHWGCVGKPQIHAELQSYCWIQMLGVPSCCLCSLPCDWRKATSSNMYIIIKTAYKWNVIKTHNHPYWNTGCFKINRTLCFSSQIQTVHSIEIIRGPYSIHASHVNFIN